MRIDIIDRSRDTTKSLARWVKDRIQKSFGRFNTRIKVITVSMQDMNGARGGTDKEVAIQLESKSGVLIRVEERSLTYRESFTKALGRIKSLTQRNASIGDRKERRRGTRGWHDLSPA